MKDKITIGCPLFSGCSLPTLLTIIFVVLKLCNVIAWSWWWVFSPIFILIGIIILVFLMLLFFIIREARNEAKNRNYWI